MANQRKGVGENDVFAFICSNSRKKVEDLIARMISLREQPARAEDEGLSRWQRVCENATRACVDECDGRWLVVAKEVLEKNNIPVSEFSEALRNALKHGRAKGNNIMLIGPRDCGKSFLLEPIEDICSTFSDPTAGRYAWVELEGKQVIYLNDIRYTSELIPWSDFLVLF